MEYYIIQKLEYINSEVIHKNIGYFTHSHYTQFFYDNYEKNWNKFIENNIEDLTSGSVSISTYFDMYENTYVSNTTTDNIEGYNLPLVNVNI